jgi:flavin reductase (DIM6/NTAB) family NADH-FMN oxidoreductase RutF
MYLDVAKTDSIEVYQALVGIVSPRPIAWVSTVDKLGRPNLAPFSFYNTFGSNPPVVVFSPTTRNDLTKKDTLLNLMEVPEFVINSAVWPLASEMNASSKEIPRYESEAEMLGLELISSTKVKPQRVKRSPVQMEGKVLQIIPVGDGPRSANLVIGEILCIHIDDAVLDAQGKIDPRKLQTIGRLGGQWFCRTSELFELVRPV